MMRSPETLALALQAEGGEIVRYDLPALIGQEEADLDLTFRAIGADSPAP